MTGSHEVSGSIPLISTRTVLKSHDFRTFLYFLPQIVSRIFAVMRPDPDLTQTGAKTRWIY